MTPEPQDDQQQEQEGQPAGADTRHLSAVDGAYAGPPLPGAPQAVDAPEGDDGEGRSLEDMDAEGAGGQLPGFENGSLKGDPDLTLAKITRGLPLQFENKMMGTAVGAKGGLSNPREIGRAMVAFEVAKIELVPQREGEPGSKKIVGWIVRQHLRPTYTEDLDEARKDPATLLGDAG